MQVTLITFQINAKRLTAALNMITYTAVKHSRRLLSADCDHITLIY